LLGEYICILVIDKSQLRLNCEGKNLRFSPPGMSDQNHLQLYILEPGSENLRFFPSQFSLSWDFINYQDTNIFSEQ
ncbi:MAG: hypothetical protein AAFO85_15450, partial [Cyanobacteria bacterium J06598_4]